MRKNFYLILFCIFITIILVLCSACVDTNGNDDDDTPEQPKICIFNYGQKTKI